MVYDGSFLGKLIGEDSVTAALSVLNGTPCISAERYGRLTKWKIITDSYL